MKKLRNNWMSIFVLTGLAITQAWSASLAQPALHTAGKSGVLQDQPSGYDLMIPVALANYCAPRITFTYIPPYGSFDNLQGATTCVSPADYRVAVYIFVSGWWTKPSWASPLTTIKPDGTWSTDITTGGSDQLATQIAAFLVKADYKPPKLSGEQTIPQEQIDSSEANIMTFRTPIFREIQFANRVWKVKASETAAGPGPNYFSDREEDVWVDQDGRLHLKIVYRDGRWNCTEVITNDPLGYGTYTFELASRVDLLDKNVVLGLFTWDDSAPEFNYREVDIEFSRWGEDAAQNAQYVVQPWDHSGNRYRFDLVLVDGISTHSFEWRADQVKFDSTQNSVNLKSWQFSGSDIPPAGNGNARINLWLLNGLPPSDGQEVEVIVQSFSFLP